MKENAKIFLSKALGNDFLESLGESLSKSEIFKQGTRTVTDTNDLYQGLQIVPRALLSLLIRELSPMQIGEIKEITIPGKDETIINVTKHERDSFSGQVFQNNVKINDFMHRSIPGLGLVLLSVLELYDIDNLADNSINSNSTQESEINKIIDERLNLHSLINKVVDGKMIQRDAVQQLILSKLNELSLEHKKISEEHKNIKENNEDNKPTIIVIPEKKKLPLEDFVEKRKKKLNKREFSIQMAKGESFECPDCGNEIFNSSGFNGCICYGENMDSKVYIKKSDSGIKVSFPRAWTVENIEMLLEVLRSRKNG